MSLRIHDANHAGSLNVKSVKGANPTIILPGHHRHLSPNNEISLQQTTNLINIEVTEISDIL